MKKYLVLIPLVISLISLRFFSEAYNDVHRTIYEQKYQDVCESIELVAMQIAVLDQDDISFYSNHKSRIQAAVEYIDSLNMVYAALYSEDLQLISERITLGENSFEPFEYEEFKEAIMNNDFGRIKFPYDNGTNKYDEMSVYYKWASTINNREKYLLISGVSLYSPKSNVANWVAIGTLGIICSLVVLQVWMVIRISSLADVERDLKKR